MTLAALVLGGCGSGDVPKSLDSALLRRAQLPAGLPPPTVSVSNGAAVDWVRATTPDPQVRARNLARVRQAGFQRGSARQFRAAGSGPRVLLLIEAVAQLKHDDGAQRLAERTARRARQRTRQKGGRDLDLGELGDFRAGSRAAVQGIPVYAAVWRKGRLVYFLSLASNPNGGPGDRTVVALARKLDRRWRG